MREPGIHSYAGLALTSRSPVGSGLWLAAGLSYAALGAPHPAHPPGAECMAISAMALPTGQIVPCRAVSCYLMLPLAKTPGSYILCGKSQVLRR